MTGEPDNLSVAEARPPWAAMLLSIDVSCFVSCSRVFRALGPLCDHTWASTGVNSTLGEALRSVEAFVATSRRVSLLLGLLFQKFPRLARLLALATQKFIADIAADAYQYSRIRASNTNTNNPMGSLGAAAGFPIPGQPTGPPGSKTQDKGAPLGIQRPGYGGGGQGGSQNRTVLTMEDLGMAVGEYGVNVKRSEFYR